MKKMSWNAVLGARRRVRAGARRGKPAPAPDAQQSSADEDTVAFNKADAKASHRAQTLSTAWGLGPTGTPPAGRGAI